MRRHDQPRVLEHSGSPVPQMPGKHGLPDPDRSLRTVTRASVDARVGEMAKAIALLDAALPRGIPDPSRSRLARALGGLQSDLQRLMDERESRYGFQGKLSEALEQERARCDAALGDARMRESQVRELRRLLNERSTALGVAQDAAARAATALAEADVRAEKLRRKLRRKSRRSTLGVGRAVAVRWVASGGKRGAVERSAVEPGSPKSPKTEATWSSASDSSRNSPSRSSPAPRRYSHKAVRRQPAVEESERRATRATKPRRFTSSSLVNGTAHDSARLHTPHPASAPGRGRTPASLSSTPVQSSATGSGSQASGAIDGVSEQGSGGAAAGPRVEKVRCPLCTLVVPCRHFKTPELALARMHRVWAGRLASDESRGTEGLSEAIVAGGQRGRALEKRVVAAQITRNVLHSDAFASFRDSEQLAADLATLKKLEAERAAMTPEERALAEDDGGWGASMSRTRDARLAAGETVGTTDAYALPGQGSGEVPAEGTIVNGRKVIYLYGPPAKVDRGDDPGIRKREDNLAEGDGDGEAPTPHGSATKSKEKGQSTPAAASCEPVAAKSTISQTATKGKRKRRNRPKSAAARPQPMIRVTSTMASRHDLMSPSSTFVAPTISASSMRVPRPASAGTRIGRGSQR